MKLSIQESLEQRLQFIIGFTQLTLMEESKTLWVISQIVSNLQKIAILKLVFHMQETHNVGVQIQNSYTQDLELLFKLANPSVFIPKVLSYEYIFASQFILWFSMITPLFYVTVCMIDEIELFKQSKFKSKNQLNVQQSENIADSIQIMHQIYNHHNYIENFQHKLMQDRSINTPKMFKLRLISIYINYFPHVFLLPILYFILEADLLTQHVQSQFYIILIDTFNILISVQVVIIYLISMIFVQLSYCLHDSNYLKLSNSYSEWFHQFFYIIPLIIGYFSILWNGIITLNSTIYIIIQICILMSLMIDYYNDFNNIPYIHNYKYHVSLTMKSIITLIVFFSLTDFNDQQIINQTFILSPLLAKFLVSIREYQIENILKQTMKKEKTYVFKKQQEQNKQNGSSQVLSTESGALKIEINNQLYKEFQTSILKHHNLKYFIHFLSLIQQMNLGEIGIYTKNSGIKMNIQKSRILMNCIILLQQHTENCSTNKYCFCRGLKGEKRQIIKKFEIVKEMKMYDDFKIVNIQIYVELIMRYLRDYAKLVFQLELKKQQPNIMYLQKILIFLLNSDECYTTQLLLLQLKNLLNKSSSILERQSLELLLSLAKFQILNKMQSKLTKLQIEITLKYEDFRLCELDRDKVLSSVIQKFKSKRDGLIKLNESNHTYESLEALLIQMTNQQLDVEVELQDFKQTALSRTSLYCYMLYCLEGSNNYDLFIKLCNSLNTTETKFFEYPPFYYNTEEQAYRVGFVLLNLSQSPEANQQRGHIVHYSKHLPQFLGYSHSEFKDLSNMSQILYPSLLKPHTEMVEIFVLTNRPNVFRIQLQFFCQQKTKGLITQIENFIDISFNYRNNILPCYCFLKEVKRNSIKDGKAGFILVDRFGIIESVTEQVCKNFELVDHHSLYLKQIQEIMPVFENIRNNLEDKLMRYFEKNQQEDEDDTHGQTLTTQEKLVQTFSTCYDQTAVVIKTDECIMQYQLDVEAILRYSKLNRVEYKIYQLEIKNVFKLGAACSEISPLTKTLSEYSDTISNQAINLKEYAFVTTIKQQSLPDEQNKQSSQNSLLIIPQITSNPLTQRTQFNQELQQLKGIDLQQDYLCSEFHDIQSRQELDKNKQDEDSEEQQQRLYINSLSSTSQGKSEIQRIIQKSHYYSIFAEVQSKPILIYVLLLLNIFSLVAILSFSIANTVLYDNWQDNTKNNIQILQAFTMTAYARVTTQGSMLILQELQKRMNVTQYLPRQFDSNATEIAILQQLTDQNIHNFQNQMDTFSQNQIIRSVFTSVKLKQIDVIDKVEKSVDGWTALFQLIYMMNCLYSQDLSANQDQYVLALYYMLQSYQQYNEAYFLLNTRFTDEIYSLLNKQDYNIDYIAYIALGVFMIYCFLSFMLQHSFYQLLKKYVRCCEQISHQAIENEINHLDKILENFKNFEVNIFQIQEFDLYEYHFSLKEKIHNEIAEENMNHYKTATVSNKIKSNSKKFIEIHNKFHLRRSFTFIFYNISFILTIIVIFISRSYDKQLIGNLQFDLSLYQKCIKFTESIAESSLTNFALQIGPLFLEVNLFDEKDSHKFYLFTNESYNQATSILSEILFSDTAVGMQLKDLFSSNICLKTQNITLCESTQNGVLKDGLLLPQQDILQIIRENIDLYESDGMATVYLQMDDLICQNFMIDAIQSFVNQVRFQIENQIVIAYGEKIIIWTLFFVCIILVNLAQLVLIQIYLVKRIKSIRRFVFILPSHALYVEESFLKTLNYLQRIENSVFYI